MEDQGGWRRLVQVVRRRPAVWAGVALVILVVVVIVVAVSGGGGQAPAARASATPEPGAVTVDDVGHALNAKVIAVERAVLADARARNRAALDRLLSPGAPASLGAAALNKVLAQSGTYAQIITLLTRTHGASQNGFTIWPGFFLAGTSRPVDAADARVLGAGSGQQYAGVTLIIGASATENPYVPKLVSITRNVP